MHDLAVLQVRLEAGPEPIRLTSVTLDFVDPWREEAAVDVGRLRVRLLDDANGNGHADTDEDVLVTEEVHGMMGILTLELPPWDLQPGSPAHLLVTLDMDSGHHDGRRDGTRAAGTAHTSGRTLVAVQRVGPGVMPAAAPTLPALLSRPGAPPAGLQPGADEL